jgi:hypothetical protein
MPDPSAAPLRDTLLDGSALYFVSYDGLVNNNAFQKHGVLTYAGYQYAVWYDADRRATIGRRRTNGDAWASVALAHKLTVDDSHNVICAGISPQDGRIHILMDSHSSSFFYVHSAAGLADGAAAWSADSFGTTETTLGGVELTPEFTYPQFVVAPSGRLQLSYRTGISGNGCAALAEYDDGSWTDLGAWSGNAGLYTNSYGSSAARNLYLHGTDYGTDGRLHVFGTWRERDRVVLRSADAANGGLTNHDTVYVYSNDEGRTWRNASGTEIGRTGSSLLVSVESAGLVVDPLGPHHALMNQESQAIDAHGLPHALVSYVPDRYMDRVTDYVRDRVRHARAFHVYQDASMTWHKDEIPVPLNSSQRSQLVFDRYDNAYAVLPYGRIVAASAESGWQDWTVLYDGTYTLAAFGEVVVDHTRVAQDGVLSFMYQRKSTRTIPSPLHMIDFQLAG